MSNPDRDPVGTCRIHPDGDPRHPDTVRLVKIAVASSAEWPWRRVTGIPTALPSQGADLSTWPVQPLGDVALALGHPVILTGREVISR